ncbi:MAG TPA: hypothetical protein VLS96_01285, partial [Nodosilinea sp.]|nr:hypothetical protein [Nodosilinea sp.]
GLDIGAVFMGGIVRPSVLRSRQRLLSLLVTEALGLGVVFILCFGLALVLVRHRPGGAPVGALLVAVAGVMALGTVAWHLYQWRRARALGSLARLLDAVDRHNDIIQALQVIDELAQVQPQPGLDGQPEVLAALQATHGSLISALMTEKILRTHRPLLQRRQTLASTLETHLATLHTLQVTHQASEYRQFLQEALAIGLAVQEEMVPWDIVPQSPMS